MLSNPFVRNPSALPPSTTTYTLVASNGICRDTGTVQVQVYPLPIVDAGQSKFICAGDTAQMQATGGVTYNWQPAGSLTNNTIANPGAFPSSTTVYTVTITDSNGCSRQDFVQVGVLPAPNIQAGSDKVVCAGSATMLTVTGGTSYTWQPANSLNNNTIANPTATPTATTQYIVEGLGGNGCSATDTVVVQVSPYPTSTVSASPPVVCPNDTVQLSAMGGSTYQWQPASLVSNASIANPQSVLAQDTMLYVQVTDSNGCSVMDSILLQTHNLPVISSGGGDSICQGESTTLQAAGGISYNWAPGSSLSSTTVASPVATPSTTTTYTLSVTDANGCSNTDQLTVVVLPTPTAQAGPDLTLCEGAATSLQASGGTSYQWSPGTDLSCTQCANPVVVPTQSRTYTVQVTDTFGCTDEDDININIVPLPATQVSASPAGICPGGQVQLTASGGVGYQWSPAASLSNPSIAQPTARPTATTWYTVQITDTTGCVATDSVRVSVFNLPNLSAGQDQVICASGAVQLQATGAVTYQWSPGTGLSQTTGATVTASPTVTTQYTLTGTDANGCTKQDTVEVAVHPLPTAQAGADIFACENEVVQLNGSGGSQYSWTPGSGLSCSSCPNPQLNVSTNRTYVLQVTDANGCSDTDTLQVNALPAPQLSTGPDTTICPNSMVALNTQSNAVSYTWSPTAGLSNPNTASPTASPAGSVVYTLQATGANGCISTDSVSIQLFPGSQVTTGADTAICAGEQVTLTASAMASYQWSPDSSLSDNSIRRPVASPNVTTTYTVFSTDLNGCTSTATQRVTVHPIPNLQLTTTDTTICVGTSVTLGVSGANTYQWNPANTLSNANSNAPVASPLQQTIYTILGTSGQNCTASATVEVDFYPLVTTGLPASASMCPNDSVPLKAEGGIQYTWQPTNGLSDPSSASPLASPDADIVYTLLMIDTNQCTVRDSVAITVWPDPDADAGADQTIFTGESTTLWGSGNGSLQWTPGQYLDDPAAAQPTATPDSSTLFHLVVTSQEGCIDTDAVFIKVLFPTVVYVPNAFSPNGDGQNDLIGPVTFNDFELEYFQVYNRWGQLVFETADATARWDGTMGGVPQPIGTYVYLLRGKGNRGEPFVKQGNITLFR